MGEELFIPKLGQTVEEVTLASDTSGARRADGRG